VALQPISGVGHLIVEVSRSHTSKTHTHTHTHTHIHTVVLLWKNDQPVAEAATYTIRNKHKSWTSTPSAGFEPAIPAVKRLQTYAVDMNLYVHNILCDEFVVILFTKIILSLSNVRSILPVPVASRSKAWVCGLLPAGIVGLNPAGGMDICRECWVLSGRGLCDELISRPGESYQLRCVVVCRLETTRRWRLWPAMGCSAKGGRI
jgi:hypothetical protein